VWACWRKISIEDFWGVPCGDAAEEKFRIYSEMTTRRAVQKQKERYLFFAEPCKHRSGEKRLAAIAAEWATAGKRWRRARPN
jgi:hypothetical protein